MSGSKVFSAFSAASAARRKYSTAKSIQDQTSRRPNGFASEPAEAPVNPRADMTYLKAPPGRAEPLRLRLLIADAQQVEPLVRQGLGNDAHILSPQLSSDLLAKKLGGPNVGDGPIRMIGLHD